MDGVNIRLVKDTDVFGGPNMWNLEIQRPDGHFESVQWLSVGNAERITGKTLTQYKEAS